MILAENLFTASVVDLAWSLSLSSYLFSSLLILFLFTFSLSLLFLFLFTFFSFFFLDYFLTEFNEVHTQQNCFYCLWLKCVLFVPFRRTPDGYGLFACSVDGTVAFLEFNAQELGVQLTPQEFEKSLKLLYGDSRIQSTPDKVVEDPLLLVLERVCVFFTQMYRRSKNKT